MSLTLGRVGRTLLRFYQKYEWTQYAQARDKVNYTVSRTSPSARKFCLAGAIYKMTTDTEHALDKRQTALWRVINLIDDYFGSNYGDLGKLINFNDDHTHKEVFQLLEKWSKLP